MLPSPDLDPKLDPDFFRPWPLYRFGMFGNPLVVSGQSWVVMARPAWPVWQLWYLAGETADFSSTSILQERHLHHPLQAVAAETAATDIMESWRGFLAGAEVGASKVTTSFIPATPIVSKCYVHSALHPSPTAINHHPAIVSSLYARYPPSKKQTI